MSNVLHFPVEQVRVRTMPRPKALTALEALAGAVPVVAEAVAETPEALTSQAGRSGLDGARPSQDLKRAPSPRRQGLHPVGETFARMFPKED